jgi:hypothetical protein
MTFMGSDNRFHDNALYQLLIENPLFAKCLLKCVEEVHRVYPKSQYPQQPEVNYAQYPPEAYRIE